MKVQDIPIAKVEILENVRTRLNKSGLTTLMESINQRGLLQPIGVGKQKDNGYALVYGHRRLEACKKLGYKTIPAIIDDEVSLAELLTSNATENLQRVDVLPSELGRVCGRLQGMGLSVSEIAAKLSVPKGRIKAALTIYNNIPADLRKRIIFMKAGNSKKKGSISATVANHVLQLRKDYDMSADTMRKLMETTGAEELSSKDLGIIALLLDSGKSLTEAKKERRNYRVVQAGVLVEKSMLESQCKKHKLSAPKLLQAIVHGKIPAMPEVL